MFWRKSAAVFVHLLTASGVLCSLFAFVAITNHDVRDVFLWLGLALIIDALDGPLARFVDTKKYCPRFSGERLDLIIDYLNYVALPAFLLVHLSVIEGEVGQFAAVLMLMTSLFHFSDLSSKTDDGYFVGFPALWNVVVFYLLAFKVSDMTAITVIVALSLLTFVPLKWLHPFRVGHLRGVSVMVVLIWTGAAFVTILAEFNVGMMEKTILVATALYLIVLSFWRTIVKPV